MKRRKPKQLEKESEAVEMDVDKWVLLAVLLRSALSKHKLMEPIVKDISRCKYLSVLESSPSRHFDVCVEKVCK